MNSNYIYIPLSSAPPFMSIRLYRLHYEILQFYQFMIPTEEEHAVRQQVVNRITSVINQYLPTASVRNRTRFEF
jgi:DNA polymerase sigma